MSKTFTAVLTKEGRWHVAHCIELGVVSQGRTVDEAKAKLKEAVELYIESFGEHELPESTTEVVFCHLEVALGG